MDKKRVCACYFSPCGNVEKTIKCIAAELAEKLGLLMESMDFTLPKGRGGELNFSEEDIVVIGTPVYAGRVPNKIMPYVRDSIHGSGSACVCVVCYGNRSFENGLSELVYLMGENGMQVVAGAAVVSEHSFAETLAPGRPDAADLEGLKAFAAKTAEKLVRGELGTVSVPGDMPPEKYYTPLKEDGRPAKFLKAVPAVNRDRCVRCGSCASICPMGSISPEDPALTVGPCIKCQACIKACPQNARFFTDADFLSHRTMLLNNYTERKESEFFL